MDTEILFNEINGKNGDIGQIILNRPQALNALNLEMIKALDMQLSAWEKAENIKAVIIRSASEKAFCGGGDIRKICEAGKNQDPNVTDFFKHEYRLNQRIFHYQKPYIALLDGITMGGGVGISIHGSHRIATEKMTFAMPETGIGFFPDIGGSYFLPRCPGKIGFYLGLAGARLKSADAVYAGIAQYNVQSAQLENIVQQIVNLDFSHHAHDAVTAALERFSQTKETPPLSIHKNDIDNCFAGNTILEMIDKLKKLNNEWAQQTIKTLLQKSPTSLVVTLQQLQRGATMDFDHCMQMEYTMVQQFLKQHDFYEGVRAVIIDKDQNPKWEPASIEKVKPEEVESYFK